MREANKKHGRKGEGRSHGGKDSKKPGRRRMARTNVPPPATALLPKWFTDPIEARSVPAPAVDTPRLGASPIAPTAPPLEGPAETEPLRPAVGVAPRASRRELAVLAFAVAAICGVAALRACEPKATPIEDDAAETDSCSDDASLCVARA